MSLTKLNSRKMSHPQLVGLVRCSSPSATRPTQEPRRPRRQRSSTARRSASLTPTVAASTGPNCSRLAIRSVDWSASRPARLAQRQARHTTRSTGTSPAPLVGSTHLTSQIICSSNCMFFQRSKAIHCHKSYSMLTWHYLSKTNLIA